MSETTVQDILDLEEQLRQAEMRVDRHALGILFADDIMITAPIGIVVNKAAFAPELDRAVKLTVERFDKEDISARVFGDTAVTSYLLKATARTEAGVFDQEFRVSNVWMKRQGPWQVVARHTATIGQPKAEKRPA